MHKEIFCFNSRGWVVQVQFQLHPVGGDDQTQPSRICSFMAIENTNCGTVRQLAA